MACEDLASEEFCKDVHPHCNLGNNLILCAYTCNADSCVCKDDPGYPACKDSTPAQCKKYLDLEQLCPKTCNKCPGA